jgi:Kdo-III transferase WaaZ
MTISVARRVGKTAYGLFRGKSRRHQFDAWPGLEFERDSAGRWAKALYRGRGVANLIPGRSLTERPADSIVVVGAGPSLQEQCLNRLRERDVILTNGSLCLIAKSRIKPLAVFIEDEGFVLHSPELVLAIPDETHCFFTPAVLRAICEIDPEHLGRWRVSLAEILHRPIQSRLPRRAELASRPFVVASEDCDVLFSMDCDLGFASCGTVAFCALQLAVQCAPRKIGLAGVDLAYFSRPRINETDGQRAPSHLQRRLPLILKGISLTSKICRERGIVTENYSALSLVPTACFPYDGWLDNDRESPDPGTYT